MKAPLAFCLLFGSCGDGAATGASARPSSSTSPIELPRVRSASPAAGSAPAGAPLVERERAVTRLFTGEGEASALPLADTDPAEPFDPRLRAALRSGAKITIEVETSGMAPDASKLADATIAGRRMKIMSCYAGGLTNNPNLIGKVALQAVVAAAGRPEKVENLGTDLPDSMVAECIRAEVSRLTFPAPEGPPATLTVRVRLAPGG